MASKRLDRPGDKREGLKAFADTGRGTQSQLYRWQRNGLKQN